MSSSVKNIIEELNKKSIPDIIKWMVSNLELKDLMSCITSIDRDFKIGGIGGITRGVGAMTITAGPRLVSVNMIPNTSAEDLDKIKVIELTKNSGIVPVGFIPPSISGKMIVIFIKKEDIEHNPIIDKLKGATVEETLAIADTIENVNDDDFITKLDKKTVVGYVRNFLNKYMQSNCQLDVPVDKCIFKYKNKPYDSDDFVAKYGLGNAWDYSDDEKAYAKLNEVEPIFNLYSRVFMDIPGFDVRKKNNEILKGSGCVLLGHDADRFPKSYFVRTGKNGDFKYDWYSSKQLDKTMCPRREDNSKEIYQINDINDVINHLNADGVPFSNRVYPPQYTGKEGDIEIWEKYKDIDLRRYGRGAYKEDEEGAEGASAKFGAIQKLAAKKNIYLTGVKFGNNSTQFYGYMFDGNNKGKWEKERERKNVVNPKGKWFDEKELDELLSSNTSSNTSNFGSCRKKMLSAFGKDVYVPLKVHKETDIHLRPLHPMEFGFMQEKKWDGQLYPLGKDAYFKGAHQGVSSNFSQQFSEDNGLWNPKFQHRVQPVMMGQFQFGKTKFGADNPRSVADIRKSLFYNSDGTLKNVPIGAAAGRERPRDSVMSQRPVGSINTKTANSLSKALNNNSTGLEKYEKMLKAGLKPEVINHRATLDEVELPPNFFSNVKQPPQNDTQLSDRIADYLNSVKMPKNCVKEINGIKSKIRQFISENEHPKLTFGGALKKKKSCFGSAPPPNDWTRNGIVNGYTGKRMAGIANNLYGYNGTQSVYGGNTGVVGYSGLSNQTADLMPFR